MKRNHILNILSIQFGKNTASKSVVFTSQREIIRTLKVTNIDFFYFLSIDTESIKFRSSSQVWWVAKC